MKKQSSKTIRIKLPKKKRFPRFFLRRLLLLTLTAALGGAMILQHYYLKAARDYDSDCSEDWRWRKEKLRVYHSQNSDSQNIEIDEKDIQTELNRITRTHDTMTNSPAPYEDHAAMLIDAENLTYYVSQPEVLFYVHDAKNTEDPDAKRENRPFSAGPELSEQIETELRDLAGKRFTKYSLLCFLDYLTPYHPVTDALYTFFVRNIYNESIPIAVYLDDGKVCGAEYGYINPRDIGNERAIPFVYRHGTVQQEGMQVFRNSNVSLRDGRYIYQERDSEDQPDEAYLYHWNLIGMPQDTDSGALMAKTVQKMEIERERCLKTQKDYQYILDDKSGRRLYRYYKEETQWISDEFQACGYDMSYLGEALKDIASPKEELVNLYRNFGSYPEFVSCDLINEFTTQHPNFYYSGTEKLQINGRTWYLFHYDHEDWLRMNLRFIIFLGFLAEIVVAFAALIWASIAYLRFKHRYEIDEYRRNLTASLAHDLKSPLMAISSYSENLLNDVQPEKKQHYSQAILDNTKYMDSIIVNVLELSRLECGKKPKRKIMNLTVPAEELLAGMQDQLNERGLNVSVMGSCFVKADCEMMKQALRNLLDNAVKYTPEGGSITVTARKRTLSIVNDIAEEQIADPQQLCAAFAKGDASRSNRMGTGLGLSIVQQIAAQNKLRLHIESGAHQFRVRLRQRNLISLKRRHKAMNLTPLAEKLLAGMQEQLDACGLKTAVSGRCIVFAEYQMMTQVIRKLLINAVKFTPEGGSITITGQKHTLSIVIDMKEEPDKHSDAGSKCESIEQMLAAVQPVAGQNRMKVLFNSSQQQICLQLKQNTLFSPICSRRIQ